MSNRTDFDVTERIRIRAASALEPILRIDTRHYDRAFTLALILTVLWVIVRTVTADWGTRTKLMPIVVGVPTLLMLLLLLAIQVSPRVAELADRLAADDVLGMGERVDEMQAKTSEGTEEEAAASMFDSKMDVVTMCFWVLLLFGLVLVIGFTLGIPAYLLAYYRLRADLSWIRAIGLTALIWVFVVVIFIFVLNAPLYPGMLGIRLPFL